MDPRLYSIESRKQFARTANAAKRYKASSLQPGEADIKNNPFITRPFVPLFKQQLREGQDIGNPYGAQMALDPTISAAIFRQGNYGVDDIATLQGISDFYG
jgi:hypothetical protein